MLSLGRDCPDLPCETLFDRQEWQAAWIVSKRTEPPPEQPKLQDMIRIIASLGGFLARKGDGEPGPQTLWIGLDMVRHFVTALAAQAHISKKGKRRRRTYGKRSAGFLATPALLPCHIGSNRTFGRFEMVPRLRFTFLAIQPV